MRRLKKWMQRFTVANAFLLVLLGGPVIFAIAAVEAPTGFDDQTNGLVTQAQFTDQVQPDGRTLPVPGAAKLVIVRAT